MLNVPDLEQKIRDSFTDKDLYLELKKLNAIIAGGAITSLYTGRKINDFDIYFRDSLSALKAIEIIQSTSAHVKLAETDNAITFKYKGMDASIQIIKGDSLFFDKPLDLIKSFDFTINMAAFDLASGTLTAVEEFERDNIERRLIFNEDSKYPITSLHRAVKYMQRGYRLSGYEQVKISLAINKLVINDYNDLKRHLQGIDTAIFAPITDKLIDKDKQYSYNDFKEEMKSIKGEKNENNSNEPSGGDSTFL